MANGPWDIQIITNYSETGIPPVQQAAKIDQLGSTAVKNERRVNIFTRALRRMGIGADISAKELQQAGMSVNQLGIQATRAQTKFKRFGSVGLQQVGYQVGDFAVQVQGGTNALVALGQQGSQLLGILGPMGAIAGAALAIWTAIARVKQETSSTGLVMEKVWEDLEKAIEPIRGILTGIGDVLDWIGRKFIQFGNFAINNLERMITYAATFVLYMGVKMVYALATSRAALIAFGVTLQSILIKSGIGIFVVALGELAYRIIKLKEILGSWGEVWDKVKEVGWNALRTLGFAADSVVAGIAGTFATLLIELFSPFKTAAEWLDNQWTRAIINIVVGLVAGIGEAFKVVTRMIVKPFEDAMYELRQKYGTFFESFDAAYEKFGGSLDWLKDKGLLPGGLGITAWFSDLIATAGKTKEAAVTIESSFGSIAEAMEKTIDIDVGGDVLKMLQAYNDGVATAEKTAASLMEAARSAAKSTGVAAQDTANKLKELADLIKNSEDQIDITEWFGKIDEATERTGSKVEETMDRIKSAYEGLSKSIEGAFSDFFNSLVDGTKTVADAFKDMARKILAALWDVLVTQQIVNSIMGVVNKFIPGMQGTGVTGGVSNYVSAWTGANGGAFSNGKLLEFADGGIVNRPTLFPMANGMGLMGEAGPEAVMPLKRGRDGKLGVAAEGGGGDTYVINQSFNFSANGDDSVKRILLESAPQISNYVKRDIIASRQRGGQMRQVFR